ncbi:periplasmic heavy metal sensor [Myxococcus sp. MxC21-1]|uniref:periplasmic heavy metal sensor n=1 Tax=Myxococcus sp. MxC21-1 TaxID=3041439 RepID=UPI0029311682|nr:periplasmic heavy metal sensor [Myxococcus sp. MxC21-1]WNZ60075.1 periplasmic heavy metal sensor [Myxococcus sp. MxC21-1]
MFGFVFGTACLAGLIYTVRGGRHGYRRGGRWSSRGRLRWLFERLDTSPGQEKVLLKAADDVMEAFAKVRDEAGPSRTALGAALRGEHFDGAALRELFARHDVAIDNVRRTVQGALAQVHEALDPRQRRELADLLEHGFGSAYGWHGGHGGWHRRCGGPGGWRGGAFGHGGHRHGDGHGPWGRDDARGV